MKSEIFSKFPGNIPVNPELFQKIEESLVAFCGISQLPLTLYNSDCEIAWEHMASRKLCDLLPMYHDPESPCRKSILSSARISGQLGEAYVFVCKGGFAKISMPLFIQGELKGYFIAGPILMGDLKESLISKIIDISQVSGDRLNKLILFLRQMKAYAPKDISYLSTLFQCAVLAPLTNNSDYINLNVQYLEQRKIGQDLQKYKREHKLINYPLKIETDLIASVKSGNLPSSTILFKNFFDEIVMVESGNLSAVKTKILGVCMLLSRSLGKNTEEEDAENPYFYDMNELNEAKTIGELYDLSSRFVERMTINSSPISYMGNSQIVKLALAYIGENFESKIQLKDMARLLHTNPSYLSALFKQETGLTFSSYVNKLRIMKSKELLRSTNSSLAEIAELAGFEDQSYFSKMFKQVLGITPKQYRKDGEI